MVENSEIDEEAFMQQQRQFSKGHEGVKNPKIKVMEKGYFILPKKKKIDHSDFPTSTDEYES